MAGQLRKYDQIAAADLGAIVTVEEHSVHGGLGGAVAEVVATTHPVEELGEADLAVRRLDELDVERLAQLAVG